MSTAQSNDKITTPEDDFDQLTKGVTTEAQKHVPSFAEEQARPMTDETPIPSSPELEAIGAQRIGSNKPNIDFVKRDTQNLFRIIKNLVFGGNTTVRTGEGNDATPITKMRTKQQVGVGKKKDPSQLDIGE